MLQKRLFDDLVLTEKDDTVEWTNQTAHMATWAEPTLNYYFNYAFDLIEDKIGWAASTT